MNVWTVLGYVAVVAAGLCAYNFWALGFRPDARFGYAALAGKDQQLKTRLYRRARMAVIPASVVSLALALFGLIAADFGPGSGPWTLAALAVLGIGLFAGWAIVMKGLAAEPPRNHTGK